MSDKKLDFFFVATLTFSSFSTAIRWIFTKNNNNEKKREYNTSTEDIKRKTRHKTIDTTLSLFLCYVELWIDWIRSRSALQSNQIDLNPSHQTYWTHFESNSNWICYANTPSECDSQLCLQRWNCSNTHLRSMKITNFPSVRFYTMSDLFDSESSYAAGGLPIYLPFNFRFYRENDAIVWFVYSFFSLFLFVSNHQFEMNCICG